MRCSLCSDESVLEATEAVELAGSMHLEHRHIGLGCRRALGTGEQLVENRQPLLSAFDGCEPESSHLGEEAVLELAIGIECSVPLR